MKYKNDIVCAIYEMLKGNRKLDFELLHKAKKIDLINAMIMFISKNVEYYNRTEDQIKST